ncbi:MAG: hypothetical protein IPN70_05005 [Candidatus Moraniibacteriota bacterium]|nr:MAG: hypothetical protein IPN70_05005 [Candidatus Moranbacteria bacterium]
MKKGNNDFLKKSMIAISYKLSIEALMIMLFFCFIFIFSEFLLPNLLSSHVSFFEITLALLFLFFISFVLGKKFEKENASFVWELGKKRIGVLVFFLTSMIIGMPDKLSLGVWFFVWIATFISLFFLLLMIFSNKNGRESLLCDSINSSEMKK